MRCCNFAFGLLAAAVCVLSGCESEEPSHTRFIAVPAQAETRAVPSSEDAADDPAVWVHPQNPLQSLILATDKHYGLMVYNLQGEQVQTLERGRLNNVDLRSGVVIEGQQQTLAVATNRTRISLDIFTVSDSGSVSIRFVLPLTLEDPYGVCMHVDQQGMAHVFVNSTDGEYQHWLLNGNQMLEPELLNSFRLGSQPEGCAVDDVTQVLYLGEEDKGVWMLPLSQLGLAPSAMRLLDSVASSYLKADIEGMDVYRRNDEAYLVVSSQGNDSYAFYDLAHSGQYMGSIQITDNPELQIDGAQETDGLAVTSAAMGLDYPEGLLVVQDGYNTRPDDNQNFKLVSWQVLMQALRSHDAPSGITQNGQN